MTTLTLDHIDPTMLVSANKRIHHHQRAKVCRYWRAMACGMAIFGHWDVEPGAFDVAHVVITVRYPDRRRRDVGNLYPYVAKPIVDGLVDAEWIYDDSDEYVIGPDLRRDPDVGPLRVTVEIEGAT